MPISFPQTLAASGERLNTDYTDFTDSHQDPSQERSNAERTRNGRSVQSVKIGVEQLPLGFVSRKIKLR
jgi:hypothetical protein